MTCSPDLHLFAHGVLCSLTSGLLQLIFPWHFVHLSLLHHIDSSAPASIMNSNWMTYMTLVTISCAYLYLHSTPYPLLTGYNFPAAHTYRHTACCFSYFHGMLLIPLLDTKLTVKHLSPLLRTTWCQKLSSSLCATNIYTISPSDYTILTQCASILEFSEAFAPTNECIDLKNNQGRWNLIWAPGYPQPQMNFTVVHEICLSDVLKNQQTNQASLGIELKVPQPHPCISINSRKEYPLAPLGALLQHFTGANLCQAKERWLSDVLSSAVY